MTVIREEKGQTLSCCQTNSTRSSKILDTQGKTNNNLSFNVDNYDLFDVNFPRREEVDIEFQNIKYTVRKFSFSEKKFGKFLFLTVHNMQFMR